MQLLPLRSLYAVMSVSMSSPHMSGNRRDGPHALRIFRFIVVEAARELDLDTLVERICGKHRQCDRAKLDDARSQMYQRARVA